jgi:hypothetical protein
MHGNGYTIANSATGTDEHNGSKGSKPAPCTNPDVMGHADAPAVADAMAR